MIIPDAKKNRAALILGDLGGPKPEMPPAEDKPEDDDKMGLEACAQDLLHAIEMKDAKMLAQALHEFVEMAQEMPDKDEPEEEMPS